MSNPSKGAIVYLTDQRDFHKMSLSLQRLDTYYNNRWKAPVVIFHPAKSVGSTAGDPLTIEQQHTLRKATRSSLTFAEVDFSVPSLTAPSEAPLLIFGKSLGYRQMCAFFAFHYAHHPALKRYDYVWRFDSDAFLLRDVREDLFEAMERGNWTYGWRGLICEPDCVVVGLENTVKGHLGVSTLCGRLEDKFTSGSCKSDATLGHYTGTKGWSGTMYYNNFEVVHLPWLRSREYSSLAASVDAAGGIWMHRWGDAPIRTLAVQLLLPRESVHQFTEVAYEHQGEFNVYAQPDDCLSCTMEVGAWAAEDRCGLERSIKAWTLVACVLCWAAVLGGWLWKRGLNGKAAAALKGPSHSSTKLGTL